MNDDNARHIRDSLMSFYEDSGAHFWSIFDQTPQAAVAAFKARPEIFGTLANPYKDWPKMRGREHARISARLELLLAEGDLPSPRDLECAETDA